MLTVSELLQEDETFLGDYNIEIARWVQDRWWPTQPPIYAILTEFRLILQPQARKRHEPAIIPVSYIIRVKEFLDGRRHGVLLYLQTGHQIGMFVVGDPSGEFLRKLREAILPHAQSKPKFKIELDLASIQKMISYFETE